MFAVVVREAGDAAQIDGSGDMVSANVAPRVREAPGFVSALWMSDGAGRTLNVLVFASEEAARALSMPPAPRPDRRSCASSRSTCSACWRARRGSTSSRLRSRRSATRRGAGAAVQDHLKSIFEARAASSSTRSALMAIAAADPAPADGDDLEARVHDVARRPDPGDAGPARGVDDGEARRVHLAAEA